MYTMPLETWMSGFCFCVSGNQAHGVQKAAGSSQVSLLDLESAATDLPLWKSRAGRVNTAPVNRRRRVTAVCGPTNYTRRSLNDASTPSSDGTRAAVNI